VQLGLVGEDDERRAGAYGYAADFFVRQVAARAVQEDRASERRVNIKSVSGKGDTDAQTIMCAPNMTSSSAPVLLTMRRLQSGRSICQFVSLVSAFLMSSIDAFELLLRGAMTWTMRTASMRYVPEEKM
jgi:hypothetical protein